MLIPGNIKYYICRDIKLRYVISLFIKERLLKRNRVSLYYLNPNANSILLEKCSNFLRGKKGRNFSLQHYDCDMSIMENEKGIPIIKASGCDDLNEIIGRLSKTELNEGRSVFDYLDEKLSPLTRDLKLYVKQQIALDIFHDLFMANAAHWLNKNRESELYGKGPVLLMEKKSYWSYLIADHLKSKGVNFKFFRQMNLKRNKAILFTYHTVKLFVELTRTLMLGQRTVVNSGRPKIGIPFYTMQNFTNFFDIRNYYLFWFHKSGIDPDDILIYVPDTEFKLSDKEVSNIKKANFNIVFCPTRIKSKRNIGVPVYQPSLKTAILMILYLKQIIKMYIHARGRFMREQWKLLSLLFIQLPYWEDFFTNNNIRIKFRFHDIFGIRDIAAKLSEAIVLSYHYSNASDARITREEISDVFFIWGKRYEEILSPEYSTTDTFVQTGYIFDYTFEKLKDRAQLIRDSFSNKATYLIGIFSENLSFYLAKAQMKCYKSILEYAVNNSDVGLIIKPKKEYDESLLKSIDEIKTFIDILIRQNRIRFLESGKYPIEAGLASNIVIGMIPDSTAALECALAGVPTVIYDCTNSGESHPLYVSGHNKIIFNNIEQLLNMINSDKENPCSISGFADWSPIFMDIDPFRDGKANIRIGFYIKTLICKLDDGLTKDDVIKTANETYANEFGWDKIIFPFD